MSSVTGGATRAARVGSAHVPRLMLNQVDGVQAAISAGSQAAGLSWSSAIVASLRVQGHQPCKRRVRYRETGRVDATGPVLRSTQTAVPYQPSRHSLRSFTVAGVRNLTQAEAVERARLLTVDSYDITVDLTDGSGNPGDTTFRSVTEVRFGCFEPGASTFIEVAAHALRSATLNGVAVDLSGWSDETGLPLTGLAADNVLVVEADYDYSNSGQGLHRAVDP